MRRDPPGVSVGGFSTTRSLGRLTGAEGISRRSPPTRFGEHVLAPPRTAKPTDQAESSNRGWWGLGPRAVTQGGEGIGLAYAQRTSWWRRSRWPVHLTDGFRPAQHPQPLATRRSAPSSLGLPSTDRKSTRLNSSH